MTDISLIICMSGIPNGCMQHRRENQLQRCRQSEMLAIYRNSLHMKTPTPLRERMGRWLPMDLRAGLEPPSACLTTGHGQQSQYDFSDSFIASGISNFALYNGTCTQTKDSASHWLLTCEQLRCMPFISQSADDRMQSWHAAGPPLFHELLWGLRGRAS